MSRRSPRRPTRRELTYWVLCGVFVLVGAVLVANANSPRDPVRRVLTPVTSSTLTSTTHQNSSPKVVRGLDRALPLRLIVPSLGISTSVGQLGLQANHQVQVPTNVHTVGWFRLGPSPGQVGSSVILGHVDSYLGPGVFFDIKTLPVGALIEVVLDNGVTGLFRVVNVVQYAKTNFPDALVYGASGARLLNLVTCGGTFNHLTGSYESNIVVFSRLVGMRSATTS
jgi:hypothetical protein